MPSLALRYNVSPLAGWVNLLAVAHGPTEGPIKTLVLAMQLRFNNKLRKKQTGWYDRRLPDAHDLVCEAMRGLASPTCDRLPFHNRSRRWGLAHFSADWRSLLDKHQVRKMCLTRSFALGTAPAL